MSASETNWGVQGSQPHTPAEVDEHAIISSVHGKKVFIVDSSGNQVSDFGGTTAIPTGINGGDVAVGTTQVEMTFTGTTKAMMIQSKVANTGFIWVGLTGVTNSGGNAFAQLSPGQSVSIDLDDTSAAIYVISDTAAQTVYKSALT